MHTAVFTAAGALAGADLAAAQCDSAAAAAAAFAALSGPGPVFGGACVTIPLKESVLPLAAYVDPAVRVIGAANTLISLTTPAAAHALPAGLRAALAAAAVTPSSTAAPTALPALAAFNTDWIGIALPLAHMLTRLAAAAVTPAAATALTPPVPVALVCGAGGTARAAVYALLQLGFPARRIVLSNRSRARALEVQAAFPGVAVVTADADAAAEAGGEARVLNGECGPVVAGALSRAALEAAVGASAVAVAVAVSTVPANARMQLPECLRDANSVFFEAAYAPKVTAFMKQAGEWGAPKIRGIDMLIAQGKAQNRLWTGKVNRFSTLEAEAWRAYSMVPDF
jgi:shikimate 5-dehydrogenase